MNLRTPHLLYFERRESVEFDFDDLLAGGSGASAVAGWVALAPHLGEEVPVAADDLAVFDALPAGTTVPLTTLADRFGAARVDRLVAAGLLLTDTDAHAPLRERDQRLRNLGWWGPAALMQAFGRWRGVDVAVDDARLGRRTLDQLVASHGVPPPATLQLRDPATWRALPAPAKGAVDDLLARRATCRNFDTDQRLPLADLGAVLHRAFGAQATMPLRPDVIALKKNSPSGGGLHPVEAFVLAQRVADLPPGLYHYQPVAHALEPLRDLEPTAARAGADALVAGQRWFGDAPVLVLMAARFDRSYWKYRHHRKAWKVIQLDAGHLSQNLYLGATELGYGAFVTGAINDDVAEALFDFDGVTIGAVAVCGFGRRSGATDHVEFDPLGKSVR